MSDARVCGSGTFRLSADSIAWIRSWPRFLVQVRSIWTEDDRSIRSWDVGSSLAPSCGSLRSAHLGNTENLAEKWGSESFYRTKRESLRSVAKLLLSSGRCRIAAADFKSICPSLGVASVICSFLSFLTQWFSENLTCTQCNWQVHIYDHLCKCKPNATSSKGAMPWPWPSQSSQQES